MSIINDALKKAEIEKKNLNAIKNISLGHEKKRGMNWGPIFVLLVLLLVTGPIVAPLFSTPVKNESPGLLSKASQTNVPVRQEVASASTAVNARRGQFGIEEVPLMTTARMPGFMLSGIVYSTKESYCLINDQIVKPGDTVRGAKVESISQDGVTLNYQGQKIVLRSTS